MLCIANMNLKKLVQAYSSYAKMFLKQVNGNYQSTVFSYFFLNIRESDENDDSDFEILPHFEIAIVAE